MASLRTALRLSLLESDPSASGLPTAVPKKKAGSVSRNDISVKSSGPTTKSSKAQHTKTNSGDRTDRDKRKLCDDSGESPRRNQRRTANFEISEEEANMNGMDTLSSLLANGARVVVVSGAGLSCASGIPAFRSSKTSKRDDGTIWGRHVESMGTRTAFLKDPKYWYNSFWLQSFAPVHMMKKPSAGHEALSELANISPRLNIVTQNVDGLQQHTAVVWEHENRLIEAHGRVGLYRCSSDPEVDDPCPYAEEKVLHPNNFTDLEQQTLGHGESMKLKSMKRPPSCPFCNQMCLPLALLFDEDYTDHVNISYCFHFILF